MKLAISILSLVLMFSSVTHARIGESPAECVKRYGEAVKSTSKRPSLTFIKDGMTIMCGFRDSKCAVVFYFKEERDASGKPPAMGKTEIQTLLDANSNGQKWTETPSVSLNRNFLTEDLSLLATYKTEERLLSLITKAELLQVNIEAQKQAK